ncbi:MAG: IS110 family transposase [Bacteroidia bacterium]|nr:IS110 family transposase [Bacteroidia bacterium]
MTDFSADTKKIYRIGIDIAKNVFQIHGVDKNDKCILRKKISRRSMIEFFSNLPPCIIGMEACGGSHFWARKLTSMGHTVRLIAAKFVKPYVKNNKNDARDAEAICEAISRPGMNFVPVKNVEQHDLQSLHRIRELTKKNRTALVNQIRGLLMEYGIVINRGVSHARKNIPVILEDADNELTATARDMIGELHRDLLSLDLKLNTYDQRISAIAKSSETCKRLMAIDGVGELTATALLAAVGNAHQFKNGRALAAWIGLVPRQHSSGGKTRLSGISKHGNSYLRTLLVHGGRAVIQNCDKKDDSTSKWLSSIKKRTGTNCACVARANKVARVAWVILAKGETYRKAA